MEHNQRKKQVVNPYLPTFEYIPDGEPRVFGNRIYIYGSHDRANGTQYCQNDYVCWSANIDDLAEWRYEGYIYRKEQDPRWTGEPQDNLFAPDVVRGADGRYYLYYCMEGHDSVGVAVCEVPAGKYEFLGYIHDENGSEPGAGAGDWIQADPAVLVDDDGSVYVYSGFNPPFTFREDKAYVGAYVMKLKSDMITMEGERKIIFSVKEEQCQGHDYFEAPSIRKIHDMYYFVYSSQACHELCYAVSCYPDREFIYKGVLISNVDWGYRGKKHPLNHVGNNHGGMVEIRGQWYIFYHRPTNRTMYSRQGSAERLVMESDGTILQAEMTSCGLNNAPLDGVGEYDAGIACNLFQIGCNDVDISDAEANRSREKELPYLTQDGEDREEYPGTYIAGMRNNTVAGFKYFSFCNTKEIRVAVRGNASGVLQILDGENRVAAETDIMPSVEWAEIRADFHINPGVHPLFFMFKGKGELDFLKFKLM